MRSSLWRWICERPGRGSDFQMEFQFGVRRSPPLWFSLVSKRKNPMRRRPPHSKSKGHLSLVRFSGRFTQWFSSGLSLSCRGGRFFHLSVPPAPPPLDEDRQHRQENDREDNEVEVALHPGSRAEEVAGDEEERYPGDAAREIEDPETSIRHAADAGHERREGADNRHEARQHNRLAAMLLIKPMRPQQVLLVQEPGV